MPYVWFPHIPHFERKSMEVHKRFCTFNNYYHKVLTDYGGKVYQIPINLATINAFYGKSLTPFEAEKLLDAEIAKVGIQNPINLEEKAISLIGRPLYDAFIKGYTIKQWGTDPRRLPPYIIARIPLRYNYNVNYFDDAWQGIPRDGYNSIFNRMLDHPNVQVHLNTDYFSIRHLIPETCMVIYTGPVDRFFDCKHGKLGWRTVAFEKEVQHVTDFQGTAVMNYAEVSVPFTRIHEFRHYHEERKYPRGKTVIFREYSKELTADDDPYYPINTEADSVILTNI